jgi:crossover junction endodeoxyribonuclease RuvC
MVNSIRILGLDPGLQKTGWGVVDMSGTNLTHIANGTISSNPRERLSNRLVEIYDCLREVLAEWKPASAAVEETFVNKNPSSTLKLGQARGIALLVPALAGIPVEEYSPNHVKKAVVGAGHASKDQIFAMVSILLPGVKINGSDAADALAVAICHAHHASSGANLEAAMLKAAGGQSK